MLRVPRPARALGAWVPCLACGTLLVSGCTDRYTTPISVESAEIAGAHYAVAPGTAPPEPEFVSSPPFDLDVEVHGSFKPGQPLHLSLAAVANVTTADGELRLTLPEVASAEDSGWDVVVMPMNKEFRPHLRVRKTFSEGEKVQERTTITIPEPGYYHLIATGQRHPTMSDPYASTAPSVSSREFWLWIDEHGGRMTERYDTSLFAPGTRKQTGPRGSERRVPRVRRGEGDYTISCSLIPTGGGSPAPSADTSTVVIMSPCPTYPAPDTMTQPPPPSPPPAATATFTVSYLDGGAGNAQRPLVGARYLWTITSTAGGTVATGSGFTGSDGKIGTIDCQGPTSERQIAVQVYTLAEYVNVKRHPQNSDLAGVYSGSCGGSVGITANAFMSHLFTNLVKTADGHRKRFSFPPERIYAVLYDDTYTYYDFLKPGGELHIAYAGNMIWGEYGVMVAAHEHGHLWQDRKLWQSPDQNGLIRYWSRDCQRLHPPESQSSLPCAFGEAFADWYAVVVRETDLPTWKSDLETNRLHLNCVPGTTPRGTVVCTSDGSTVQGAVSAFFWDIIDGPHGEANDYIQRSPQTLADAIKSCKVYLGGWNSYTGVDHLIFCIENRFPYRVAIRHPTTGRDTTAFLFPARATNKQPSAANGYAFEPQSQDFRRMWLVNLYSKRPDIGTSPVFYSVLPEPEPEPDPEPVPDPTDPSCVDGQRICPMSNGRRPAL
jgi:hypothetical protein